MDAGERSSVRDQVSFRAAGRDRAGGGERAGQPTKDQVKADPSIEGEGELSEADERRLFEHYGVPYTSEGSTTAEGAPGTGAGHETGAGYAEGRGTTDDAMTRSEEEVRVGTAAPERGRARLRKHVVTEQVQQTEPVQAKGRGFSHGAERLPGPGRKRTGGLLNKGKAPET